MNVILSFLLFLPYLYMTQIRLICYFAIPNSASHLFFPEWMFLNELVQWLAYEDKHLFPFLNESVFLNESHVNEQLFTNGLNQWLTQKLRQLFHSLMNRYFFIWMNRLLKIQWLTHKDRHCLNKSVVNDSIIWLIHSLILWFSCCLGLKDNNLSPPTRESLKNRYRFFNIIKKQVYRRNLTSIMLDGLKRYK